MATWIEGTVVENYQWHDTLFSLKIDADFDDFTAGQFTKLALDINGERVQRAYSFVNSPSDKYIEVYVTLISEGLLSPKLHAMKPGDKLLVSKEPNGYFTLDEVHPSEDLWMLATGTGLGPYFSIMNEDKVWEMYSKVIFVHGVRYEKDLSYQEMIKNIQEKHPDQFIYQPCVTREDVSYALPLRITDAIRGGDLESSTGIDFSQENSQVMICGNPQMVEETKEVLMELGLTKNLRKKPGNISSENYW
ncbi:MAG: ferredoxin--NADP reductase [Psittacicella sp.]